MRSPTGASAALVMAAYERRVTLVATVPLMIEYEATCCRAEHRLAAGLDQRDVEQFLDALAALIEPVETHFLWRPTLRDPADEMVLEAAVSGDVRAIVSFNQRDYGDVPPQFGVDVILPGVALRRLTR